MINPASHTQGRSVGRESANDALATADLGATDAATGHELSNHHQEVARCPLAQFAAS
jgi:hypothetical protein